MGHDEDHAVPERAGSRYLSNSVLVPTRWTRPTQIAVAAWFAWQGLFVLASPLWIAELVGQLSPDMRVDPFMMLAPPRYDSVHMASWAFVWVGIVLIVAMNAVFAVGALKRWKWAFFAGLWFTAIDILSGPTNLFEAIVNRYDFPIWALCLFVAATLPGAALCIWMFVAWRRFGPWAMTDRAERTMPAAQAPIR